MSEHPSRDDLLGYQLKLLEDEQAAAVAHHIASCSQCAALVEGVEAMMERAAPKPPPVTPTPTPAWRRALRSSATPLVVMVVALLAAAVPGWLAEVGAAASASLGPLVIGAILVVAWLRAAVSHAEAGWRAVSEQGWHQAMPADLEDRLRMAEGIRISLVQSLRQTRDKVTRVLVMSLVIFIVAATITLMAGVWEPAAAALAAGRQPLLMPSALALGVLLGGVSWASWRLTRLARAVARFMESVTTEVQRG